MSINADIIVLCALLAAGALYVCRPMFSAIGHSRRSQPLTSQRMPLQAYRAASVSCEGRVCAAARELRGKKFLLREAPHLPLPDCDQGECSCRWSYHEDRRGPVQERRDLHSGEEPEAEERRLLSGRRRTDWRLH